MPIHTIEVNEYECSLCGYKWINRVNGEDKPVPKRCASCKRQRWEKGELSELEKSLRDALRQRFGYFWQPGSVFQGGWRIEENIKRYLQSRPPVSEVRLLLRPMSYLHEYRPNPRKSPIGCVVASDKKHVDMEATKKAHQYERGLSRQLLKGLMTERGIPYDEKEAKIQSLYSHHGKYAIHIAREVPKLCIALKEEQPELSNEDIRARVLGDMSDQFRDIVGSPEELIKSCWPD